MIFKGLRWRTLSSIKSHRLSLEESQANLAWNDSQSYIYDNLQKNTKLYSDQITMRKSVFDMVSASGAVFEFGVYQGSSINFFADLMLENHDDRIIVGFDSFTGFSEDWSGVDKAFPRNRFDLKGELPKVRENVRLIDGFIENTLPTYLLTEEITNIAFVHIDTDTYTPSKTILSKLKAHFSSGTILLFDELLGYTNWRNHEFRALSEELDRDSFEYIAFGVSSNRANLIKAAIRIL